MSTTTSSPSLRFTPRRLLRALLWSAAVLITLYALLCATLGWIGSRALVRSMAHIKADGETLDFKSLLPPPVDPTQNFCAIPALEGIAQVLDNVASKGPPAAKRKALEAMRFEAKSSREPLPRLGSGPALGSDDTLADWTAWLRKTQAIAMPATSSGNDAADLRQAIETAYPVLKDIATAATQRPASAFTPGMGTEPLPGNLFALQVPHYSSVMPLTKFLELHAKACVLTGDGSAALADTQAILRIVEATQREPLLIGLLVSVACETGAISSAWHALRERVLTEPQLATLQVELQRLDTRQATLYALRGEVAAASCTLHHLESKRGKDLSLLFAMAGNESASPQGRTLAWLIPSGLIRWNHATLLDAEYEGFIQPAKLGGLPGLYRSRSAFDTTLKEMAAHPILRIDATFARLAIPAISGIASKMIAIETQRCQALLACALERYFIQHQAYPKALAELVPTCLAAIPTDLMDDKPLRYRPTASGRYKLWATGFDGKDDEGKVTLGSDATDLSKLNKPEYQGDWTWQYEPQK